MMHESWIFKYLDIKLTRRHLHEDGLFPFSKMGISVAVLPPSNSFVKLKAANYMAEILLLLIYTWGFKF